MHTHAVFIALGSNLNDPASQVERAIQSIASLPHCVMQKISPFYHTKPMGYAAQDDFINAVILIDTQLSPLELLSHLKLVEQAQGRVRDIKNGPRTIDCDIVLFGDITMHTPELTLPHPGLLSRDFVLKPLLDIAPDACLPDGQRLQCLCDGIMCHYVV